MTINKGRWTAQLEGDFVLFLIGAAVHDPVKGAAAEGLIMAMLDMLGELEQDPSKGLLGYQYFPDVIVQYWRSFEALEDYARNPDAKHAPVWRAWNQLADDERNEAGVWHETYKVAAGGFEAIYANMPEMGLQKAGTPLTVADAKSARERMAEH